MHTTKDIAARLGVNAQTVRRWAETYQRHMSANLTGDAFQYTDDDLLLLWSVRRWRQLGYSLSEIEQRLSAGERTTDELPVGPVADDAPPRAIMVPEGVHTAALAEIRRLEGERERLLIERDHAVEQREQDVSRLNDQIRGLEREIGELRGKLESLPPLRFWLAVMGVAIVVTVVIMMAAWIVGQGGG